MLVPPINSGAQRVLQTLLRADGVAVATQRYFCKYANWGPEPSLLNNVPYTDIEYRTWYFELYLHILLFIWLTERNRETRRNFILWNVILENYKYLVGPTVKTLLYVLKMIKEKDCNEFTSFIQTWLYWNIKAQNSLWLQLCRGIRDRKIERKYF